MKRLHTIILGLVLLMSSSINAEEELGVIGEVYINGLPVIYKFVNELPPSEIRKGLPWLAVISWKYDGATNNGMPSSDENQRMIVLEDAIENEIETDTLLRHVYSATGNNLKELVYHISDQEVFLKAFNHALTKHKRYPIEISFFEDKKWEDFKKVLSDFSNDVNEAVEKAYFRQPR